tara:strand:+ start:128 stop:382 length:255 start_codon:yes stop_codon:yes gene_type:complete
MLVGIGEVVIDIMAATKGMIAGWSVAFLGFTVEALTDYINPTLATLTPILSAVLVVVLIRVHLVNHRKASLEIKKLTEQDGDTG